MLEEGSLESTFYPFLLVDIYSGSLSGMLSVSSDSELRVYFQNGSPVYAEGGDRETLIGRVLMSTGKIDPGTHKEILEKSIEEKKRIGDVLIETGWVSPHEMNSFLELQIEERIMRGFCSLSGVYRFSRDEEPPKGFIEQRIELPKVLNEAVKRYIYAEPIEEINPKIKLTKKPGDTISSLELKPKELRMIQLIKSDMHVVEILSQTKLEKYEALKLLYLLAMFKIIELPGVPLESIGRRSAERYINENRMTAKPSDQGALNDDEELIELELEVYESELTFENGAYNKSEKQDPAPLTLDDPDLTEHVEPKEVKTTGPFSEKAEGLELDSPESEPQKESSDTDLSPEEILINPEDHGVHELKLDDTKVSLDLDTAAGINQEHGPQESSLGIGEEDNEVSSDDSLLKGGEESESVLSAFSTTENTQAAKEELLKDSPKEITIDDTELFSTFEQKEYGFETPQELNKDETSHSGDGLMAEDSSLYSDNEFSKRVVEFHSTLSDKDFYGVLGVAEDAPQDEIRDSYYKLVKDFHPDVNQSIPGDIREKAQEIFTAINSAYETLSDSEKRKNYNSEEEITELKTQAQSIYEAEVEFKRGIVLLVQRNYGEAASKLGEALKINPEESAYIGAYAWARFLSAEDKNGNVADMIGELTRAIDINPSIAENYYYLGSIQKSLGEIDKAEQNYAKALETDPEYIEAKRELRLINSRKKNSTKTLKTDKMEKRFWSGLFKK